MATLYTDLTDSTSTHQNAHQRDDGRLVAGSLGITTATYTNTGSEVTGDTIKVCKLPTNVVVLPQMCWITHGDMATTAYGITTIGDATDADRYSLSASITMASDVGIKPFIGDWASITALPAGVNTPYVIAEPAAGADDNRMILAVLDTITLPTASAVMVFHIVYRVLR